MNTVCQIITRPVNFWQVIGIQTSDPKAGSINTVDDLDKAFPGQVSLYPYFEGIVGK